MPQLKITVILEISDHDGYCSDGDCEYSKKFVSKLIPIPQHFPSDLKVGTFLDEDSSYWIQFFEVPHLHDDSMYCGLSHESEMHNLGRHEYRYTPYTVEVVDDDYKLSLRWDNFHSIMVDDD